MTKRIYMDNAATTALSGEVLNAMMPVMTECFGNASSIHAYGREAAAYVEKARAQVAAAIGAAPSEIVFTGSGTEADNLAIHGYALRNKKRGNHIITTTVEHHAVLHTCEALEKQGYEVTYLPVDEYGLVTKEQVEAAIKENTILVSIMFANNEVGSIMPIEEIGKLCRERKIAFHTDAVQAVCHVPIDVNAMNIDMLSISAHKIHGPKGVGALYVRKGILIEPLIVGGAQEKRKRAGTENVAGIVGLGAAIEIGVREMPNAMAKVKALRDRLIDGILSAIPEVKLNGHRENRLPGNVNVSIRYIEGEAILLMLDINGIAASSGSACTSGSLDPSHVLLSMGIPHEIAHGSLRLSLSDYNTDEDVDYVLSKLPEVVAKLRKMSPLYNG
ncbi:MAG: cysteine desulfurase NifS [Clostridia bacterium]|nr:cysteine desulfurase NifS [Clostridia bacterium]